MCQPDVVVNVASGMTGTATLEGPVAIGADGDSPLTIDPDANTAISVTGGPGNFEVVTYTVTDAGGDTAQCSVRVSIELGESVGPWSSAVFGLRI